MDREIATFVDKYGDERIIRKTRRGLQVKREHATPILALNPVVAGLIGHRVRALREARNWTLAELSHRIGIRGGHPKERMWAIENAISTRKEGIRLGTLYALAIALEVEVDELMPSVQEVAGAGDVGTVAVPTVAIGGRPA